MKVYLPFREQFRIPMLCDIKIYTARTKVMGKIGDTFDAFGNIFEILGVSKVRLGFVMSQLYKEEGCASSNEFIDVWTQIHPNKGYDGDRIIWLHKFRRIK